MKYSTERKEAVLNKLRAPHNRSVPEVAAEEGISAATIYLWRKQARQSGQLLPEGGCDPEGWSSRDKFNAVLETASLSEAELAEYCRRRGLYPEQVRRWRLACEQGNDLSQAASQREGDALKQERKRSRKLQRELKRKEAALAETAALLTLRKKAPCDLGGRGRMTSTADRNRAIRLVDEARRDGARLKSACAVLGIGPNTYRRWSRGGEDRRPTAHRPCPQYALSDAERQAVLATCHLPEYASLPPAQIVPRLLDEHDCYLASESTFYRILRDAGEQNRRGRARTPRQMGAPASHRADQPNAVWTWDVTYLPSAVRGVYFYLYLIIDIYSRKIVGAEVFENETALNSARLIERTVLREGCHGTPLVLHADNGSAMKGSTVRVTLERLGIIRSHSRPQVSDDNPFSEALFRHCKYRPDYPVDGFRDLAQAREWVLSFERWYNHEHRHSAIRYVTPAQRHSGDDRAILARRARQYERARVQNPGRWPGRTRNWQPVGAVWLNPERECHGHNAQLETA
ncbi:IS3 family transposase [Alkalilimnicola ehrlichii MLHE-1]|nr:IS3 family transposase [Alkalilimnicola ehrlichii]